MTQLLFIIVKYVWWFSMPPFSKFRNYIFTRYYKAASTMSAGKNVTIGIAHASDRASLNIGRDFEIGNFALIDYTGGVEIGDGVTISEAAKIYTHNHEIADRGTSWRMQPIKFSSLSIGDQVWVGTGAIVLERVSRIGKGAIIGAGSVVTRDVPDYAVCVGNPARVIKMREE